MSEEYFTCDRVDFLPGEWIDSKYLVEKILGEGTFGRVYKVKRGNTTYALKLLKLWEVLVRDRNNLLRRFDREFYTGQIKSQYLVHSLEKGLVKGNPYIIMEFCPGGDLMTAAERNSNLDFVSVALDILYGLQDLHQNGKIHRDLKPENVLMREDGRAVLTDFGIAGDQNNRMSRTDLFGNLLERFGTYAYMPPEQVNPPRMNKAATVLPTSDIFSFGVMMYQMLTHELPFGDLSSEKDLLPYTKNGKEGRWNRDLLSRAAPQWIPVIEGCLRPKIADRLQSVDEVIKLMPKTQRSKYNREPQKQGEKAFQTKIVNGTLLRIMEGESYGNVYRLDDIIKNRPAIVTIGREDEDVYNIIKVTENESNYISRCHCTIELDYSKGAWLIRDGQSRIDCSIAKRSKIFFPCRACTAVCNKPHISKWQRSLNGTYVNSKEVDENGLYLATGDIISIGDVKIRVEGY